MPDEHAGQPPPENSVDQSSVQTSAIAAIEQRVMALEAQSSARQKAQPPEDLVSAVKIGEICLIVINALLLIATIVIAVIYTRQLREMRRATRLTADAVQVARDTLTETQASNARQANLADQARKDANIASEASRKETAKALQATIDNSHQGQRAWVGISDAKPVGIATNTDRSMGLTVAFTFRNYGHSAAQYVHFFAVVDSDPSNTSQIPCEAANDSVGDVLLPTQERTLNWVMNLTPAQMAEGWTHQNPQLGHMLFLRIAGCIEYSDRQGEAPPHRTPFSYLVIRQGSYITSDTRAVPGAELTLEPFGTDSSQTH